MSIIYYKWNFQVFNSILVSQCGAKLRLVELTHHKNSKSEFSLNEDTLQNIFNI